MNKDELEERTLQFGKNLLKALGQIPNSLVNNNLISQSIKSGTSIGANYREANASESERDFKHKVNISFKEAKETRYWLDLLISANPDHEKTLLNLRSESDQLARIFGKIVTTCRQNAKFKNVRM